MLQFNSHWLQIMSALLLCFMEVQAQTNSTNTSDPIFCSSSCASYVDACYGPSRSQCYACSTTLFSLHASNGSCMDAAQHITQYYELATDAMDLTGYTSNNPTPAVCGVYQLSGKYTAGHYISKTFLNLGTNHYEVVVRFGVGYIGSWNTADQMVIELDGVAHSWKYSCAKPFNVCSGSGLDCFKIVEYTMRHSAPSLGVKVTSLITETDSLVQYWGLKDLIVSVRTCHSSCVTCTGPAYTDCLLCQSGYFLLGNVCVIDCKEEYTIPDLRRCISACPVGYFTEAKICRKCEQGCLSCNSSTKCQIWSDGRSTASAWEEHFLFWVLLIIVGCVAVFFLFWKCLIKKYIDRKLPDEASQDLKKSMISSEQAPQQQTNSECPPKPHTSNATEERFHSVEQSSTSQIQPSWVEELQEIEKVEKIKVSKPKKRSRRQNMLDAIGEVNNDDIILEFEYKK